MQQQSSIEQEQDSLPSSLPRLPSAPTPFHLEAQVPFGVTTDVPDPGQLTKSLTGVDQQDEEAGMYGKDTEAALLQPISEADQLSFSFVDINAFVTEPGSQTGSMKSLSMPGRSTMKSKQVLHNVSGSVLPGEILALMGPSGSGKTTTLSILAGRAAKSMTVIGDVTCSGRPLTKSQKRKIAFVLQDDVLYETLTVRETLMYAAFLRLPKDWSYEDKMERVHRVISALGLTKCESTIIGGFFTRGVSGGERKRTSIGVELLINPSIIMLDEPTSGLDSTTSKQLLTTLRQLATGGRAILTTIHQPSSRLYLMLDKLLLLADGHTMYYGKAHKVVEWFQHLGFTMPYGMNIADYVLDLAMGEVQRDTDKLAGPNAVTTLYTAFEKFKKQQKKLKPLQTGQGFYQSCDLDHVALSRDLDEVDLTAVAGDQAGVDSAGGKDGTDLQLMSVLVEQGRSDADEAQSTATGADDATQKLARVGAGYLQQVRILLLRCIQVRKADNLEYRTLLQVLLISLSTAIFWWQRGSKDTVAAAGDVYGLLFVELAYVVFTTLFSALFAFAGDVKMLMKERASGMYQLSAYYVARTLADLPMECFTPTLFVTIIYFTGHLRLSAAGFFGNWLAVMLSTLVSQGWGLLIGAVASHPKTASTASMVYIIVCMTVSGFYTRHIATWISWTKYLSFMYWGFSLLLKVEYKGRMLEQCVEVADGQGGKRQVCSMVKPKDALSMMVNPDDSVWPELVFLFGSLIALRIAVYLVLKRKTKSL